MIPQQIFTWGYYGQQVSDAESLMTKHNAILVDIRLKPFSRFDPQWNQKQLEKRLGGRYVHLPEWGNLNYKGQLGQGIMLADFGAGLAKLCALPATGVILMCVCKYGHKCHRATVADLLKGAGYEVTELRVNATATTLTTKEMF